MAAAGGPNPSHQRALQAERVWPIVYPLDQLTRYCGRAGAGMAIQAQQDTVAEVVAALRAHLREAGDAANVTFEADTQLVDGLRTRATVRQFEFGIDEPPSLGGTDTAPNPVEMVLAALGTCQEIVYATYARVLGVPVDGVRIKVAGDLDPRGFYGVADVPAG